MSELIKTKKDLKEWIRVEEIHYRTPRMAKLLLISEASILRKHQILLRKEEYYANTNKRIRKLIYKIRLNKMQNKYALHIPINSCGKGLKIMHLGPILINSNAKLGENCSIHINTSIVAGGVTSAAPSIGNGVVFGVGSVALGDVVVADNVAIGANAVVTKSIMEENIAIAGVPAKKISNNGNLEWNKKVQ